MSAEILRAAADRLDELAGTTTPGPWTCYGDHLVWPSENGPAANDPILAMVGEAHQDSAAYVAAMHPEVGKALAAWLRSEAARLDEHLPAWDGTRWHERADWAEPAPRGANDPEWVEDVVASHFRHALNLARLILGDDA